MTVSLFGFTEAADVNINCYLNTGTVHKMTGVLGYSLNHWNTLTNFMTLVSFYTLWKYQKRFSSVFRRWKQVAWNRFTVSPRHILNFSQYSLGTPIWNARLVDWIQKTGQLQTSTIEGSPIAAELSILSSEHELEPWSPDTVYTSKLVAFGLRGL